MFAALVIMMDFVMKKEKHVLVSGTCSLKYGVKYSVRYRLLAEETVVETCEPLSVTGLVFSHLMHGVVDSVEILCLGVLRDAHLVGICTCLSVHALLKVGLGVPNHLAEKFRELGGMFSLFPCVTLECVGHLGIPQSHKHN